MSHSTTIKTQIKDINALREACKELGLELLPNAEAEPLRRKPHAASRKGKHPMKTLARKAKSRSSLFGSGYLKDKHGVSIGSFIGGRWGAQVCAHFGHHLT